MSVKEMPEFGELRHVIHELHHVLADLRARYGGAPAVRRLENDLERLEIDAVDFEESAPQPMMSGSQTEPVFVPDSKSDEAAWMGAQDEGLGFHSRRRTL